MGGFQINCRTIRKPLILGGIYGRLTAISGPFRGNSSSRSPFEYDFKCSCGAFVRKSAGYIRESPNPSCGCAATDAKRLNGQIHIHGLKSASAPQIDRRLYDVWRQMVRRCHLPSCKDYRAWGGRGIVVCDEWRESVLVFVAWAKSSGYEPGVTIERQDNDQGYFPWNCVWIPNEEQTQNTRRIRWIEHDGKRMSVANWSRETGMPYRRLMARLNMGWSADRALST